MTFIDTQTNYCGYLSTAKIYIDKTSAMFKKLKRKLKKVDSLDLAKQLLHSQGNTKPTACDYVR